MEIHQLGSFYPAGDEQTIVHEVTGRVVPPGGLPLAAGAVVDNIATIYAISQAMEGIPFTQKILTVTGEVAHPVVLSVPVGTSFRACLELAGGPLTHRYCVVSGGPMMGRTLTKEEAEEAFVTKTTSGILVLPEEGPQGRARAVEIPLKMHIGAPCLPLVAPGDSIRAGQLTAQPPEGAMGALIHASMDGRVARVDERIAITKE